MLMAETTTMGGRQRRLAAPQVGGSRRWHGIGTQNTRATWLAWCEEGSAGAAGAERVGVRIRHVNLVACGQSGAAGKTVRRCR